MNGFLPCEATELKTRKSPKATVTTDGDQTAMAVSFEFKNREIRIIII